MNLRPSSIVGLTLATFAFGLSPAAAETMSGALGRAYSNNPDVNQARAAVRAQDEAVPQAKAGWLPKANAQGSSATSSRAPPMRWDRQGPIRNLSPIPRPPG